MNQHRIVSFGEVLLRLTPPGYLKLSQTNTFAATFGGSETNCAVSLARFGLQSDFITRLPKNDIAEACLGELRSYGLGTGHIVFGGDRLGLYYYENPAAQRVSKVVYDRANSSFSTLKPGMIDWEQAFEGASWFHWSGIGPGLNQDTADVTLEALRIAKRKGLTVSCDLNYRKNLWQYGKPAQEAMAPMLALTDVLFGTASEYKVAYGVSSAPGYKVRTAEEPIDLESYARFFAEVEKSSGPGKKFFIALRNTLDANHHILTGLFYAAGKLIPARTHAIDHVVDCVGVGDAFAAGMIYGLINYPDDDASALEFAVAAATLKNTIYGDFNLVTADEVKTLMKAEGSDGISR
ncbi:MAG: 2-dehydro-3-deoxygluconokinase [Candidatus Dactylopiibacterium carminicum]|uniref:2-dehydro-3-deoxygluconokinase n=1 Tax=Candidatus Dactylopiibacterium carminicum TaxID=857335 RepID=A0A272EMV3_9RHOO|nr:sugar kinase [Candidatus Dactylopiibacterium carminicum]KAF7597841.1 sugar kinase [Candidatus Dactylopiibacterium carminicum]PAS91431.1 MAG: 2-dehydro-3-deoxygluconokinase [Candidatus Dactylopiibacterium carminicum]PAS92573.1 MAG: 2-dehydro-3-deoxygluconokinase [Candidatus Dactylopiibacterium carminicum]PAS95707.1 MAG: 2-dehydro-3-deoxygluconokinase [Candidatus Dactylopiibacterium carminicum]